MLSRGAYFYLQEGIVWGGGLTMAGSLYYIFFQRKSVEASVRQASAAKRLTVAQVLAMEHPSPAADSSSRSASGAALQ
jgi:hypothetical protein